MAAATMTACTIVARRELARARVLVDSYRAHHPQGDFTVLLLDGVPGADTVGGAHVVTLEEILGEASGMLLAGNPFDALDAAVLPHLMRNLIGEHSDPVLYLAAGLRVLGPLDELWRMAGEHELVLVSRGLAANGKASVAFEGRKGGGAISRRVMAGSYGPAMRRLLDSWPAYFAQAGRPVDEWFDGIPAHGDDVMVLKDCGYALDLWSLSAGAENGASQLLVDGQAARLIDFSELDPLVPERVNPAHKEARPHSIAALAELRRRHAEEVLAAGYEQDRQRGWRFAALGDGTPLNELMRKLLLDGVAERKIEESPFTEDGRDAFYAYLKEPPERGAEAGLTRLHEEVWRTRPDLQSAFPHLDGPDGLRFATWLCEHAREDHGIPDALLPWEAHQPGPHPHEIDVREPLWGVNVAGFFTAELGLGEAARLLIAGLDARGVPALPIQARLLPPCGQGAEFAYAAPPDAPYPINVMCINGELIAPFEREAGRSFFKDRYTIALWWWEVGQFPEDWKPAFEHIDEVWVGSQHIYDAVAPHSPVPVVKVTMPVALPRVPARTRAELGMPQEGFLFLFVHDYHSTAARKNPLGVVEAFKRTFPPGSGAKLVVKSINAENVMHEHDRVVLAASEHPDITLIDAYVSAGDKNAMIAACDCYVSLHRSEGFGLTIAEAMLLGKPAIATRYGGNLEFMDEKNSYLVDWVPVKVGENAHPYPAEAEWAEPDIDQAAAYMREVFERPERARALGERARREVIERHSPAVAGETMEARLRLTYERLVKEGARSVNLAHIPHNPHPQLGELISSMPTVAGPGVRGRLKRAGRRVIGRLLRPFLTRQQSIDSRLHDSVVRLESRVHDVSLELQRRQEARFAEALAMTRKLGAGLRDAQVLLATIEQLDPVSRMQALERLEPGQRLDALERLGRELEHHLAQHRARPYIGEDRAFREWSSPTVGPVVGYRSNGEAAGERRYIDFEATFRGPEERVREIQEAYLPLLADHAPVLDIGCGRGELLDILRQAGVSASGIDMDAGMAAHARAKGHEVALGDGIEHLRGLQPGSLGGVTAIEVVEHLPYERLMDFLTLAHSRLRPNGVLLFETVNPHAVDAMKAFWVDPTHQHPVFPEVALELCRMAGFHEAFWFHPTGSGDFEADRNAQPVYAVLARTKASTSQI